MVEFVAALPGCAWPVDAGACTPEGDSGSATDPSRRVRPCAAGRVQTGTGVADSTISLEVAHRVDGRAVDARLEVHVRAEAVARAARVADDLALRDALADRDADARLVAVTRRQPAAVADAGVVAVAADPAGDQHAAGLG